MRHPTKTVGARQRVMNHRRACLTRSPNARGVCACACVCASVHVCLNVNVFIPSPTAEARESSEDALTTAQRPIDLTVHSY